MISVHSAMLVALGFLIAGLLGLLIGSALWSRAVRLTTRRIKASLPVSESEIVADRDRLRADFAIRVHKLESALERAKLERARQFIEVNKRDARVASLETIVGDLQAELEEHINARRVLEQTVSDRLPRVEARLSEAKRLLFNRDREIAELTAGARRHKLALEEASTLTQRQSLQIEKLSSELSGRGRKPAKGAKGGKDDVKHDIVPAAPAGSDSAALPGARQEPAGEELALRSELESLRARLREQDVLIDRLKAQHDEAMLEKRAMAAANEASVRDSAEIDSLKKKLAAAEEALSAVRSASSEADAARIAFEGEIQALKARSDDQTAEIAKLSAELETYKRLEGADASVKDSKTVLKARLGSAQAQSDQQAATIGRLRAELAESHDRLARQAQHFIDEMRRIKQGQVSNATDAARARSLRLADESLAERVAHVRPLLPASRERRVQVQELASQIKRAQVAASQSVERAEADMQPTGDAEAGAGGGQETSTEVDAGGGTEKSTAIPSTAQSAAELPKAAPIVSERRRPRLLDRLSGLAKG